MSASDASTSSGTSRTWSVSARQEEWEKITGAVLAAMASRMVDGATWDRSTSMPTRFISATISRPRSERPPTFSTSVAESAHGTFWLCVSVMYATPSARSTRTMAGDESIDWPPSAPISEAIWPSANAARTSAAVRAATKVSG